MTTEDTAVDPEIETALSWFLAFVDHEEWVRRKDAIESYLETVVVPRQRAETSRELERIVFDEDPMGWYLYLVEMALHARYKAEPSQGARVLPIFKRLGGDLDRLVKIRGVEEKARRLVSIDCRDPDSRLFEMLVALLWSRNDWPTVEFINEAPPEKRPDIRATSNSEEWYIECKRLTKTSDYSLWERKKWLRMWRYLSDILVQQSLPYVLDIIFHVELEALPDEFLRDALGGKLQLIQPPCTVISNEICTVSVRRVDLEAAHSHLKKYCVKYPSDQLNELIGGHRDPNRGFTSVVWGRYVRIGEGRGNNYFLDSLGFAAGAFWHCDAERAIERKARDIRTRLADAIEQLPENGQCVIHVGLETYDGWPVEAERYSRITNTVFSFDTKSKDVRWVYCHLYQSYSPPDRDWVVDETIYHFTNHESLRNEPLRHRATLIPKGEESIEGGVHWLRESP